MAEGTYTMGPDSGRLLVRTGRTGLGSRAGHDLTIEVTRWRGEVTANRTDPAQSAVSVDADVESMEVREGTGGVKPLTDSDRADIKGNIRKILQTDEHPEIVFRSTEVSGTPDSFGVTGDLTIRGVTRPVIVRASVDDDGRVLARATVVQSEWGIKPYSAFFGALKLADEVAVEVDAKLIPAA
ncbi:MAG: YceI family protein [Actinomycetota bacterium]